MEIMETETNKLGTHHPSVDEETWEDTVSLHRLIIKLSDGTMIYKDFEYDYEAKSHARKFLPNSALKERYDIIPRTEEPEYLIINPNTVIYVRVESLMIECRISKHTEMDDEGEEIVSYRYYEPASVGKYTFTRED